jgi:hypothetical protein
MRDARGVVFNVRREPDEIGGNSVLSIIGSDGQARSSGIRNFDELVKVMAEAEISFRPQLKLFRNGPEMLYDPKSKIWPVRDQGTSRGTCVPFAALAALELDALRKQDPPTGVDYAEEFVYARSRKELGHLGPGKEPGNDTSGATFLVQAARALIDFGVPPEEKLPYKYIQNDPAWTAPVSQSVSDEALLNRLDKSRVFVTLKIHRRPEIENELTEPFFEKESLVVEFIQASLLSGAAVSITLPVYPTGNHSPWTGWKCVEDRRHPGSYGCCQRGRFEQDRPCGVHFRNGAGPGRSRGRDKRLVHFSKQLGNTFRLCPASKSRARQGSCPRLWRDFIFPCC